MGFAKGEQPENTQNIVVKHTEKVIETPVYREVIVDKPVYRSVPVDQPVFVQKTITVDNVVVREVPKVVEVPQVTFRPVIIDKPEYVAKQVVDVKIIHRTEEVVTKVPKIVYEDEIVKVQKVVIEEVKKQIEVPEIVHKTVYVDRPVIRIASSFASAIVSCAPNADTCMKKRLNNVPRNMGVLQAPQWDEIALSYTGTQLTGVTYRNDGSVVMVLTLGYDGQGKLTSVTKV